MSLTNALLRESSYFLGSINYRPTPSINTEKASLTEPETFSRASFLTFI
jgi:hypothetical protein